MKDRVNEQNVILNSIGDAVVATDTRGMITLMNPVACQLTGWTAQEALGRPLEQVFTIVNAKTGSAVANPVGQVLENGQTVGLANHTRLIARDGRQYQIADSAAPIKGADGVITGVVLVFRDVTEEYRMREALQESRQFLNDVFESIQDGISVMDPDLTIRHANAKMQSWYADSLPLEGKKCFAAYQKAGKPCSPCPSLRCLETGNTEKDIVAGLPGSGVEWIELYSYPIKHPKTGEPTGIVEFVRDVTGAKRAEAALQAEKRRLADVLEGTRVGIWEWHIPSGKTIFDERWAEMVGYTLEEISPTTIETWLQFAHPEDLAASERQLKKHFKGECDYYACEVRMRHKNGGWVWVLDQGKVAARAEDGSPLLMSGTHQDITDRKRMENELKDSHALLQSVFNAIPDMLMVIDHNYQIRLSNYKGHDFPEKGEVPESSTCYERFKHLQKPCEDCSARPALESGQIIEREMRNPVDGRYRMVRCFPVIDDKGEVIYAVEHVQDIHDRKLAEAELQKMQRLESLGTLAGGIAHDFNNILMGIFGNISLAKSHLRGGHPGLQPLEDAESAMERAKNLADQLLTFAKGGEPVKEPVSLAGLLEETVRFDLAGSKIMPVFEKPEALWPAHVDKGQIHQVFSNLILNAREAMPDGGRLYISLQNVEIRDALDSGPQPGNYVRVSLADEGPGIDAGYMGRIFDPYFTTKANGTGLGLAICHSILSKHGGSIRVDSKNGGGARFTLDLPAAQSRQPRQAAPASPQPGEPRRAARILIMDDEAMVRDVVSKMLASKGCRPETAQDGQQAIALYKQAIDQGLPYDAVIMDLTIPGGMGGKEAIQEILALDPEARAIVSSGYADDPVMADFAAHGFRDMATKPYTMHELWEVVSRVLKE